ncbi:NAD(P)-dependent oxidoreductase [Kytococcus schroeteri]|uniref:NAD(P)-dependent oxidoreductase n=1 Tax=Kytococcus schroeteri TaxID=138300 RepID=UPI001142C833|nr:NAD(P)H-binding protein [Kytococcus schroeteri]
MIITVLGATGMAGSAITAEAAHRGHLVRAVSRRGGAPGYEGVTPVRADLHDTDAVTDALEDAAAAVLAVRLPPGEEHGIASLTHGVLEIAGRLGTRLVVIGGAGALWSPDQPGTPLVDDSRYVPPQWRDVAMASLEQYRVCTHHPDADWVYVSPSAVFEAGDATPTYRRGTNTLLTAPDGSSHLTSGTMAMAVLEEIEQPGRARHITVIDVG